MKNFKIITILAVILSAVTGLNASNQPEGNGKSVPAFLQGELNDVSYFLTTTGVVFDNELNLSLVDSDHEATMYRVDEDGNYEAVLANMLEADETEKVVYENIYFNIDLVVYPEDNALTYEFIVYPGGDPKDIALTSNGGLSADVEETGEVFIVSSEETMVASAPLAYQEDIAGNIQVINANFNIEDEKMVVETGAYEQAQVLTITYKQNLPQN